jgi:multidrug efflux pump subunit AcrA (membrane-fusion protein)
VNRSRRGARRRVLLLCAFAAWVGAGIGVLQVRGGNAEAAAAVTTFRATRGDLVVSVGGVGRIVERGASTQVAVPSGPGGSGSSAPADAVFARASARVRKLLVVPGQQVEAGDPVALLDDGGTTAATVKQAGSDLAIAELELRQKQTNDPQKGVPPSAAELNAGQLAVDSARARFARLLGPARTADVRAAQADVKKAEADLETARGGSAAARASAINLAQHNVKLAKKRLERTLAPPNAADVAAAQAELKKAEADLALLKRPAPAPVGAVIKAAEQAVTVAQQRLAKLTGPPDPVAVSQAQADVKKAEADLAALLRRPDPPVTKQEVDAANAAIEAARVKLARVLAPPDPADVSAAVLDLNKALADLAVLLQPAPDALPEALAAAQLGVDAARLKLKRLLAPPNDVDVETARLEVIRARAELRNLQAGPSSAAGAAAREAVASARAKLAQLLGPALSSDVIAARLDVSKAEADLVVLRARGGPASPIDIELAQKKVEAAGSRLADARAAEQLLTVRTPTAGTVRAVLTAQGAPVDTSTPIAAVADLESIEATVDLSEFDVAQVKRRMKATVAVDALGGEAIPGKVRFVALTGSDTSGVVSFPVQVSLTEPEGVKPGMNVSVRIIVAQRRNVVQVPVEAVTGEDEEASLTVLDAAGEPVPRRVTLGLANNKRVEIVKGLRAGELVVLPEADAAASGEE